MHRGVFAWGHDGLEWRGRCLAAVKACGPGAALSHYSAAALWRLVEIDERRPDRRDHPDARAARDPGLAIHRTRVPFEVVRLDAIPVTTPARALLDLATVAPFDLLRRAVREAMARKRASVRDRSRCAADGQREPHESSPTATRRRAQSSRTPCST